jgi:hypothetical protein
VAPAWNLRISDRERKIGVEKKAASDGEPDYPRSNNYYIVVRSAQGEGGERHAPPGLDRGGSTNGGGSAARSKRAEEETGLNRGGGRE